MRVEYRNDPFSVDAISQRVGSNIDSRGFFVPEPIIKATVSVMHQNAHVKNYLDILTERRLLETGVAVPKSTDFPQQPPETSLISPDPK